MTAYFLLQGQRGGDKIWDEGVTKPYSHISLILLWLYHTHRPPLCRARKKEGVAIVGIYSCGKAREPDKSECRECTLSLSPNDLGLVLAVKGSALPRFAPWTVLRAYPKGWWFTREWGGRPVS